METQYDTILIDGQEYILFACDIGNSALKLYSTEEVFYFSFRGSWRPELISFLNNLEGKNVLFVISSVNPEKMEFISKFFTSTPTFKIIDIKDFLIQQNIIDISRVENVGNDRVLGMIGALSVVNPPFLIFDLGTATTINLLNKDRQFVGGAILPGIFTQIRSLNDNVVGLKNVRMQHVDQFNFGLNTGEAVSSGILNGTIGIIRHFIDKALDEMPDEELNVLITGGNTLWINEKLDIEVPGIFYHPTLVLEGIKVIAREMLK